MLSSTQDTPIQQAVYEFFSNKRLTLNDAAVSHDLDPSTFSRIFKRWREQNPGVVPQGPSDLVIAPRQVGRPRAMSAKEEDLIAKSVLQFADDGWPLTLMLLRQVTEHYVK